jgi:hypothetical protein
VGVDDPVAAGARRRLSFFSVVADPLFGVSELVCSFVIVSQFVDGRVPVHLLEFGDRHTSSVLVEGIRLILKLQLNDALHGMGHILRDLDLLIFVFFAIGSLNVAAKNRNDLFVLGVLIFVIWREDRLPTHE